MYFCYFQGFAKFMNDLSSSCFRESRMEAMIRENNYDNIEILPYGVWDKAEVLRFSADDASASAVNKGGNVEIYVEAIDNVIARANNNVPFFIKMDIEGSELKALNGARNTIERYRPSLIVGINKNSLQANNASLEEVEKTLRKLRYKMYCLTEDPFFALKEIVDLNQTKGNWIICLHESFVPPVLPQPKKEGFMEKIRKFFS